MSVSIISFTKRGIWLSEKIFQSLEGKDTKIFTKCSYEKETDRTVSIVYVEQSIGEWAKEQMQEKNCLLFIGACGIAVRAIAPYILDKQTDSPVLVMDELGAYIIPILSGHLGRANEIAIEIAGKIKAVPVITTATDINGKFAVDLFAKKNGLHIVNREGIAKVSAKILQEEEISISIEAGHEVEGNVPEGINILPYPPTKKVDILITTENVKSAANIYLRPMEYIIGMGCKKGKEEEKIVDFIERSIKAAGIVKEQVFALASIERKKEEKGFLGWSRKEQIPFLTFSTQQLQKLEGDFTASVFVKEQIGVDNVCERAALRACGRAGEIIYRKHAEEGMTIAIAKREWRVAFGEK